jgi:hypothetical protein
MEEKTEKARRERGRDLGSCSLAAFPPIDSG